MEKEIGKPHSKPARLVMPDSGHIQALLMSAVKESERDFCVLYSTDKPRTHRGLYSFPDGTITLFPEIYENDRELIASGLHEVAHHVACKRGWQIAQRTRRVRRHHGREFKQALEEILGRFNSLHSSRLEGQFVFDSDALATSPWFWSFYVTVSVKIPGPAVRQLQRTARKPRPNVPFPLLSDFVRKE